MRIARYIAKAGLASRREAERLILAGRVSLNGTSSLELSKKFCKGDVLMLDGIVIKSAIPTLLYRFHKPRGCVSTSKDNRGRKTVFDIMNTDLDHLMIVGRLDYNSEGLMVFTNNGDLKRLLELPKNNFKRIYRVKLEGKLTMPIIKKIEKGITLNDIIYRPIKIKILEYLGPFTWIEMTLTEGKNREIRKIMASFNLKVLRLVRYKFGPFDLGDLSIGKYQKLKIEMYPFLRKLILQK